MRPMLAASTIPNLSDIRYPVMASPKLDGIRCLIVDGVPHSRSLKLIPNEHIRNTLSSLQLPKLDGELMINGDFSAVASAVMSAKGEPDFYFNVFDCFENPELPFLDRYDEAKTIVQNLNNDRVSLLPHWQISSDHTLHSALQCWVEEGYEGAIVRDPQGPYKFGRSTVNQGWMLKLKHFHDDEAVIIGYEELMRNHNEAEQNELGLTERSSAKANLVGGDTLGALSVEWEGVQFNLGSGYTAGQRQLLWEQGDDLIGKLVKFKYQELSKDGVPRFPVFLELRNEDDT